MDKEGRKRGEKRSWEGICMYIKILKLKLGFVSKESVGWNLGGGSLAASLINLNYDLFHDRIG